MPYYYTKATNSLIKLYKKVYRTEDIPLSLVEYFWTNTKNDLEFLRFNNGIIEKGKEVSTEVFVSILGLKANFINIEREEILEALYNKYGDHTSVYNKFVLNK